MAGDPDTCMRKLREYQVAGIKHAICMPFGGDLHLALEIGAAFANQVRMNSSRGEQYATGNFPGLST